MDDRAAECHFHSLALRESRGSPVGESIQFQQRQRARHPLVEFRRRQTMELSEVPDVLAGGEA